MLFRRRSQIEEDVLDHSRTYRDFATYEAHADAINEEKGTAYKAEQVRSAIKQLQRDGAIVVQKQGIGPEKRYRLIYKPIM
ncbi:MAG: hypothetical protein QXU82_03615 [Candidatus Aenigmatarchaeota archaeon]